MNTDPKESEKTCHEVIQSRLNEIRQAQEDPKKTVIELKVASVENIYNPMDPAPYDEKELNATVEQYIFTPAEEAPRKNDLMLAVFIPSEDLTAGTEKNLTSAIQNHFHRKAGSLEKHARKRTKTFLKNAVFGLVFLGICLTISYHLTHFSTGTDFYQILSQGFVVIGWVALWNPAEYLLFKRWEPRREIAVCKKISLMEIRIIPFQPRTP